MFTEFLNRSGLSLDRLNTLVLLSDHQSLIKAAGGDGGRQSRMSHQLRELGIFFGVELIERSGRTLMLSPAGSELAQLARKHLGALRDFAQSQHDRPISLSLGAGDSVLQWWVIPALGIMSEGTSLSLRNLRTNQIIEQVSDGRLAFGIVRTDAVLDLEVSSSVGSIEYAVVVPRALCSEGPITAEIALTRLPNAAMDSGGQLGDRLRNLASKIGGKYSPVLSCDSLGLCLAAVKTERFAAVLPTFAVNDLIPENMLIIRQGLEPLRRPMSLIWNRRKSETQTMVMQAQQGSLVEGLKRLSSQWRT